ncbi:NAD(P)/FAD-dependent oxidoreductase [Sulfuriflexus sp.]|uniref:NAD(P)/FAD-dependent oxidoreductase n=1 Tax=Sulfuriflexus sp. TaxID=2015443 RepID=UPI0028CEC38E|nr:NAD(P)/FAD-dependent oxidoreductase [Sulfuriflexus sp.]MDT8405111.1 NAD(P)/FAD-dependent oxidoreductase [Sulfuriflexus sp.]
METSDVIIVGGGPAGSTCARQLRQYGFDVIVLDKSRFPRNKVCAGWVTPAVMQSLDINLEDYARSRVLQPIRSFRTSCIGSRDVYTKYDDVVSYGIRRSEFDHYLLERSGAECRLGEAVKSINHYDNGWLINDRYAAPLLIGAGGHFCPIARHLGARLGATESPVTAQEVEFEMSEQQLQDCPVAADTPELFFTPDLKGYGWIFRKGNFLNIGLGRQDSNKLAMHVEHFIQALKEAGRVPSDMPDKLNGHAYLLYNDAPRRVYDEGVLLIGDSAGLAYQQSGEGIRPAIESALLAADTIIAAQGDYAPARLADYETALQHRFGKKTRQQASSSPSRLKCLLAGHLLKSKWFARHVVINRWFLHQQQPALTPVKSA